MILIIITLSAILGLLWGAREALYADSTVFEKRFKVSKYSFFGSHQWERKYKTNRYKDENGNINPIKTQIFGNFGIDYWHTSTYIMWVMLITVCIFSTQTWLLLINMITQLLFGNLSYKWFRSKPFWTILLLVLSTSLFAQNNILKQGGFKLDTISINRLNSGGATSGQVLKWNGSFWAPSTDNVGNIAEPAGQLVYGIGTGVDSDSNYIRNPTNNDVSISGSNANLSVRTTDTLGIITTGLTGAPNKARIYHKANHGAGITVYNTIEAPSIGTKSRNFNWVEQSILLPPFINNPGGLPAVDSVPNYVYRRGMSHFVAPSMFESDELNWWGGAVIGNDPTYRNVFEKHWQVIDSSGFEHRPLTGYFEKRAGGQGGLQVNATLFDVDGWTYRNDALFAINVNSEPLLGQATIMNDSLYSLNLSDITENTALHIASANKSASDPTNKATFLTIGGNGAYGNARVGIGALYINDNPGGEVHLIQTTSNGGTPQKIRTRLVGGAETRMAIGDQIPVQTLDVQGMAHIRGAIRANLTGDSTGLIIRRPSGTVFNTPIIQVRNFNEMENFHISTWGTTSQTLTAGRIGGFQEGSHNNTVFGLTSVQFNAGRGNNSLFGFNTGGPSFQGYENTHIGAGAGRNTTDGFQNTNIGYNAGGSITTGYQNMFLGRQAGLNTTIGHGNAGIGANALRVNITGSDNLAIGTQAGENTTGNNNIYVGAAAGRTNNGSDNVFIGYYAGELQSGSNLLIIDNSNTLTPLIKGNFAADTLRVFGRLISGNLSGVNSPALTVTNNLARNSIFTSNATPESNITANPGDIALVNNASAGQLWIKETSTGNTGWAKILTANSTLPVPNLQSVTNVGYITTRSIRSDSFLHVRNAQHIMGLKLENTDATGNVGRTWDIASTNEGQLYFKRSDLSRPTLNFTGNTARFNGVGYFGGKLPTGEGILFAVDSSATIIPNIQVENKLAATGGASAWFTNKVAADGFETAPVYQGIKFDNGGDMDVVQYVDAGAEIMVTEVGTVDPEGGIKAITLDGSGNVAFGQGDGFDPATTGLIVPGVHFTNGALGLNHFTSATSLTLSATVPYYVNIFNGTSLTCTLPTPSAANRQSFIVKFVNAGTITGHIDGTSGTNISVLAGQSFLFFSDGTTFWKLTN